MHTAHDGVNALLHCGGAFAIQDGQDRRAKGAEGALAWKLIIEQEMGQFVCQRKTLFFVRIACVNKDCTLTPVGQQASMQAAISPTYAMRHLDPPRPGQHVANAQGWNRVDLQWQRQGNGCFDIAGELAGFASDACHLPELPGHILDIIGIIVIIHRVARVR